MYYMLVISVFSVTFYKKYIFIATDFFFSLFSSSLPLLLFFFYSFFSFFLSCLISLGAANRLKTFVVVFFILLLFSIFKFLVIFSILKKFAIRKSLGNTNHEK